MQHYGKSVVVSATSCTSRRIGLARALLTLDRRR
jgi:hypothetical protein